ncbi:MAG: metalloregulator ArsR/SmtB family transcription factor [Planctomycetota bacterium]
MVATLDIASKAKLFRGLADPSRLSILEALRDGPLNVGAVVEVTGLSQPNASSHLECLFCCGLVDRERDGRFVYYRIRSRQVHQLLAAGDRALASAADALDRCRRYDR